MVNKNIQEEEYYRVLIMLRIDRFGYLCVVIATLLFVGCIEVHDTFRSTELVSSQGEKIYVNTLNWGMTDDNQYTIVSKNRDRLKSRKDTVGGIKGLAPFIYRFNNDTLYLFFPKEKSINVDDDLQSVQLFYVPLDNKEYMNMLNKAGKGEDGYQLVP